MAIHDSSPERRNLLVTSLAFIAYFYGGGVFKDGDVKLQVINVHFEKTSILAAIAWLLLFWFFYRFYQKYSGSFVRGIKDEIYRSSDRLFLSKYVSRHLNEPIPTDKDKGYRVEGFDQESNRLSLKYTYCTEIQRGKDREISGWVNRDDSKNGTVELRGMSGFVAKVRLLLLCVYRYPSFADFAVPYLLFTIALLGPAYAYVF